MTREGWPVGHFNAKFLEKVSGLGRLALGRRIRGRKESVDPRLPRGRFARGDGSCLRAVKIETNRKADLAAHRDGEKMRNARGRFLEAKEELFVLLVDDPLDDPRETRRAGSRLHALPFGQPRQAERAEKLVPDRRLALRTHGHEGDALAGLPTEVSEVDL